MTAPTPDVKALSDDDLLAQINAFDPYDVEFVRRFRALHEALAAETARADAAEARAAVVEVALVKMRTRAMSTRGEQAYRELPKYVINTVQGVISGRIRAALETETANDPE